MPRGIYDRSKMKKKTYELKPTAEFPILQSTKQLKLSQTKKRLEVQETNDHLRNENKMIKEAIFINRHVAMARIDTLIRQLEDLKNNL